jgi:uncharacterized protein
MTAVHPESYAVAERMAASLGVSVPELIAQPELVEKVRMEQFQTETVGIYTLTDIRDELRKPGRDPRQQFVAPKFRDDVKEIADLQPGMVVEGTVTNVTNFGAFVDVGVHQDGLVHVSEISTRYIKDPAEALKAGQIVRVKVLSVDPKSKRIALSIKALEVPREPRPKTEPKPEPRKPTLEEQLARLNQQFHRR